MTPATYAPVARRYSKVKVSRRRLAGNLLVFAIPCLLFAEINLVGRLFLSEILIAAVFPLLFLRRGRALFSPLPRTLILLGLLWLFGQISTDMIRGTPSIDYARGWANIAFFLINFSALYLLMYRQQRRVLWFGAGLCGGIFLSYFFNPNMFAEGAPWKFGVGPAFTLALVLATQLSALKGSPGSRIAIIVFAALLNLIFNARSAAGILITVALYMIFQIRSSSTGNKFKLRHIVYLAFSMLISVWLAISLYEFTVQQGWLGELAAQKYEQQAGGAFGLLVGGRLELLVSTQAIFDSPILGHGSWAKDNVYTNVLIDRAEEFDYSHWGFLSDDDLIPTHSHLFGAWVNAGISGAFIWLWVLFLSAKLLVQHLNSKDNASALVGFFAIALVWNVLFSPLGAETRLITAFYVVAVLLFVQRPLKRDPRVKPADQSIFI